MQEDKNERNMLWLLLVVHEGFILLIWDLNAEANNT